MTARIASLGMYDRPELESANNALWAAVASGLQDADVPGVPRRLDRNRSPADIWTDPDMLLAHCCGYPLVTVLRGQVQYVATPCYRAPGCEGSSHRSRIIVRREDPAVALSCFKGGRAAINERTSNTGMNLFRAAIAPHAGGKVFFETVIESGSHIASARLVAYGKADVAAIDCVSFAHLEHYEPHLAEELRTLGWTEATPGLPLVTGLNTSRREITALRCALKELSSDPALAGARSVLLLEGFAVLRPDRYGRIKAVENRAVGAGYPVLA
jgi:ABC-type phosphate/phosphonate transport system substrate-binding protein